MEALERGTLQKAPARLTKKEKEKSEIQGGEGNVQVRKGVCAWLNSYPALVGRVKTGSAF